MPVTKWDPKAFLDKTAKDGLDGVEEFCLTVWRPQAVQNAPKKSGTMAGSLGVERDDKNKCCYVGGGGQAASYILKQELDESLHHEVGHSRFITGAVTDNAPKLAGYVQKHIK